MPQPLQASKFSFKQLGGIVAGGKSNAKESASAGNKKGKVIQGGKESASAGNKKRKLFNMGKNMYLLVT